MQDDGINPILTKFGVKFIKIGNKIRFSPYFSEFGL